MIHVIATLTAKSGQRNVVLEAFKEMKPRVLEESGCIEYEPAVDAEGAEQALGPDTFMVVEKWLSLESLNTHNEGLVLGAFLSKVKPYLSSLKVQVLKPV